MQRLEISGFWPPAHRIYVQTGINETVSATITAESAFSLGNHLLIQIMRTAFFLLLFQASALFSLACQSGQAPFIEKGPVSHQIWDELLQKHVRDGRVDYHGFKQDRSQLDRYLAILSAAHPNDTNWSGPEQMVYWINAYNAFTVALILDHYPVESIKDIKRGIPFVNSVWDIQFIEIQGRKYDLNKIEHSILRKDFDDPRIHAAINCASVSCPPLSNRAYSPENLDLQLELAMRTFINDPVRNRVRPEKAELSKIFSWFKGDFTSYGSSLRDYVNRYAQTPLRPDGEIVFLDYDWRLNDISH